MSPEERQLIAGMFERIKANANAPRDQEAETFINEQIKTTPAAPYLLAQTVIVQDFALQSANQKLQQLEAQLRELQAAQAQKPATSFLGGLFGGGAPQPPAPPARPMPPPPGYGQPQAGPWGAPPPPQGYPPQGYPPQQGGSAQGGFGPQAGAGGGFLKGALGAAAGVAGGVLLADGIRSLFHGGAGSGLGIDSGFQRTGFGAGEETTVVNNYYGDPHGGANVNPAYGAPDNDSSGPQDADYGGDDGGYDNGGDGGGGDGGFDA